MVGPTVISPATSIRELLECLVCPNSMYPPIHHVPCLWFSLIFFRFFYSFMFILEFCFNVNGTNIVIGQKLWFGFEWNNKSGFRRVWGILMHKEFACWKSARLQWIFVELRLYTYIDLLLGEWRFLVNITSSFWIFTCEYLYSRNVTIANKFTFYLKPQWNDQIWECLCAGKSCVSITLLDFTFLSWVFFVISLFVYFRPLRKSKLS